MHQVEEKRAVVSTRIMAVLVVYIIQKFPYSQIDSSCSGQLQYITAAIEYYPLQAIYDNLDPEAIL